ncbi:glycoside hydrolase family 26 protein [Niveibacterium microcysteis]|uniref:GH26 domain-containing protein n=1 Tax=Niveibacterium microcysteis TaxID=2811415 RepID=A0ABX7M748_9RHOO|nr:glycosyl hydrolase [Niveibacterium microcysteis]QSI77589.1 hypothetical protein JY500_02725 [Niveibacterium microcysteis]
MKPVITAASIALLLVLVACGGSSDSPPAAATIANPSDPAASADAVAVLHYVHALSSQRGSGVVVGQNTGHGDQILNQSGNVGYAPLVGALEASSGELPGIVGLDYEHDEIFTPERLAAANKVLIAHWQKGGLVTINWSPQSPWLNDESDLAGNRGVWSNTRQTGDNMKNVDLRKLLDPASPMHAIWRKKLDRIAAALGELQSAGVVVLWRPMQEMNWNLFWWGATNPPSTGTDPYVAVWQDMHRYFTKDKGLHNLLWVYSPYSYYPVTWRYPGNNFVDVVAATSYNDKLDIPYYSDLRDLGKPMGMGEWGAVGAVTLTGSFDDRLYVSRRQKDYPEIAYWVSWHNWDWGDGTSAHMSINGNLNADAMMRDASALTVSRLKWKDFR